MTKYRSPLTIGVACILALAIAPGLFAERRTPLRGTPPERLMAEAVALNESIVIVGVRVPGGWSVADTRIPANAADQRRRAMAAREKLLRKYPGARHVPEGDFQSIPFFVLRVDEHTLRRLLDDEDVTSIEANDIFSRILKESTAKIGSAAANAAGYDGTGQVIAIIDDGVETLHPFFGTRVLDTKAACRSGVGFNPGFENETSVCPPDSQGNRQYSKDGPGTGVPCNSPYMTGDCPHGTKVAGIAAGKHPTDSQWFGVAPGARILPIQVFSLQSNGTAVSRKADIAAAFEYLATVDVSPFRLAAVNISLAVSCNTGTRAECISQHPSMDAAVSVLQAKGIAVIAGAGNGGGEALNVPAALTDVISVGATTDTDAVASYSDRPTWLDLFAPGGAPGTNTGINTSTLTANGSYIEDIGTSFAAPHVAGAVAVLRDFNEDVFVTKVEDVLKTYGTSIQVTNSSGTFSVPRINVDAARSNIDTTKPTTPATFSATGGSSGSVVVSWAASTDSQGIAYYEIFRRSSRDEAFGKIAQVTSGTSHTDTQTAPSNMYEYQVVAVDTWGNRSNTVGDYAVTVTFTDDPIPTPPGTVTETKGIHIAQLREAADAWRKFAKLSPVHPSYASPTGFVTASHLKGTSTAVVEALNGARAAMGLPSFTYSDVEDPASTKAISREHVQQLRDSMK